MISEGRQPCSVRIFVEPSDYVLRNVGDRAMLRTAVSRLVQKWPGTLTGSKWHPDTSEAFCPEVTPLLSAGRQNALTDATGRWPANRRLTATIAERQHRSNNAPPSKSAFKCHCTDPSLGIANTTI